MMYKCARCGNPFYAPYDKWGYDYDGKPVCSYKCMRAMRQEDEDRMNAENEINITVPDKYKKNNYWSVADRDTALEMRREGKPIKEIAERLGRTEKAVERWLSKRGAAPVPAADQNAPAPVHTEAAVPAIVKAPIPQPMPTITEPPAIDFQAILTDVQASPTDVESSPTVHGALEAAERAVSAARSAYTIDRARIISVLCDAVELIRKLLEEI